MLSLIIANVSFIHSPRCFELVVGEYIASAEDRARPLEVLLFPVSSTGNVQKTVLENREHGEHGSIDFETTLVHSSHC